MRASVSKGRVTAQQKGVTDAQPRKIDGTTMRNMLSVPLTQRDIEIGLVKLHHIAFRQ